VLVKKLQLIKVIQHQVFLSEMTLSRRVVSMKSFSLSAPASTPGARQSKNSVPNGGIMSLKSNLYRAALGFFLVLSMSVFAFADTIRLKDGSIIKGKIINFGEGKFTVLIGEGSRQRQMNFFADEVESIEFEAIPALPTNDKTSLPTYTNTSTKKESETKTSTTDDAAQTDNQKPSKSVIITDNTIKSNPTTNNTSNNQTQPKTAPTNTSSNTTIINNPSNTTPVNTTPTSTTSAKAITLNVKVLADNTSNGWTNSGWVVKKGQKIRVTGKGQISLGNGRFSSSAGIGSLPDKDKLIATEATGGLIAVVGDDNNDFIFIGATREFTATRDGALFLGINEGNLDDNSGSFEVTVEIMP
jgi:hypothetical protein